MLTIRNEQFAVLARAQADHYLVRLRQHVRRVFPERAKAMGDAGLRRIVDQGVERARALGLRTERSVCLYVDLTVGLGDALDEHPACATVRTILANREISETGRMFLAYREVRRALAEIDAPVGGDPA